MAALKAYIKKHLPKTDVSLLDLNLSFVIEFWMVNYITCNTSAKAEILFVCVKKEGVLFKITLPKNRGRYLKQAKLS